RNNKRLAELGLTPIVRAPGKICSSKLMFKITKNAPHGSIENRSNASETIPKKQTRSKKTKKMGNSTDKKAKPYKRPKLVTDEQEILDTFFNPMVPCGPTH